MHPLQFMFQMGVFIQPFKWHVWLTIAASVPLVTIVYFIITKLSREIKESKDSDGYVDQFLYIYGAILNQSR